MKAIIPAAGYGTRLRPLTSYIPKALIDINGRPVIEYVLDKIAELNCVDSLYIITNNYYYTQFCRWLDALDKKRYDFKIEIINDGTNNENERLGAIGDKVLAIREKGLYTDILDISSDNVFDFSLKPMFEMFKRKKACVVGAYDVGSKELAKKYGVVAVDDRYRIIGFEEKPAQPKSTLASTGIYMYTKPILKLLEEYANENHSLDTPGSFIQWLYKRADVYAYPFKGKWYDIGSFECLETARAELKCEQ
mgnify:CR=1 FL=1